jgi:hypothetical protein
MKQACELVQAPDQETLKGKRDRVLLGLLMECGLRREEACKLDVSQLQKREGRHVIVDVVGKGGRIRTVPIPANLAARIRAWIAAAAIVEGPLLRPINKSGVVLDGGITSAALYKHVKEYGGKLAPHDLRRTFAKLAHTNKAPVEQIKESLGHSSIKTTEIYLGIAQDLTNAPCDVLGIDDGRGDDERRTDSAATGQRTFSWPLSMASRRGWTGSRPPWTPCCEITGDSPQAKQRPRLRAWWGSCRRPRRTPKARDTEVDRSQFRCCRFAVVTGNAQQLR